MREDYVSVQCVTCKQMFITLESQTLEHQTERAHSGRLYTVHVIREMENEMTP